MARQTESIDQPYQIIVEGYDDQELIKRVLRDRGITEYQVGCPLDKDGRCQGNGSFYRRIEKIFAIATVPIKGFVIVADGDDDPPTRFKEAQGHFARSRFSLPKPKAPFTVTTGTDQDGNHVRTAIAMIPVDFSEGGLETLLLECCAGISTYRDCVDNFCSCVKRTGRRKLDEDKVKLRSFIAATHRDDPSIALSTWVTSKHRPFTLDHSALDVLADFLKSFKA